MFSLSKDFFEINRTEYKRIKVRTGFSFYKLFIFLFQSKQGKDQFKVLVRKTSGDGIIYICHKKEKIEEIKINKNGIYTISVEPNKYFRVLTTINNYSGLIEFYKKR